MRFVQFRPIVFGTMMLAVTCLTVPLSADAAGGSQRPEGMTPPLEKRWGKELPVNGKVRPVLDGYTAYVVDTNDPPAVKALNLVTGRIKWSYELNDKEQVTGSLAVRDGVVYVGGKNRLYAIRDQGDKPDLLWSQEVNEVEEPALIAGSSVYVTESGSELAALSAETGQRRWQEAHVRASRAPSEGNGILYVPFQTSISAYAVGRYGLTPLWTVPFGAGEVGAAMAGRPVYSAGKLYVGLGNTVYGMDANTGHVIWKTRLSAGVADDPVAGSKYVLVRLASGDVAAIDAGTGKQAWVSHIQADGAPCLIGNSLYVPSAAWIKAVDVRTGRVLQSLQATADDSGKPLSLAANGRFLAASAGGTQVAAFMAKDKNIKIYLDGEFLGEKMDSFDRVPYLVSGHVLAPARPVLEALEAKVVWNGKDRTVEATKGDRSLVFAIGQKEALVNGKKVVLDVAPQIVDGRAMVPLRFVNEQLDNSVYWDSATRSVYIYRTKVFEGQKLVIDGKEIPGGITLYYHGYYRVLLADAKPLFDHLGGHIRVDRSFAQATVTVGQDSLVFGPQKFVTVGDRKITVYGPYFMSEQMSSEGHFFLDLDFFAKAYGWTYQWDRDRQTLAIWTKRQDL